MVPERVASSWDKPPRVHHEAEDDRGCKRFPKDYGFRFGVFCLFLTRFVFFFVLAVIGLARFLFVWFVYHTIVRMTGRNFGAEMRLFEIRLRVYFSSTYDASLWWLDLLFFLDLNSRSCFGIM